MSGTKLANKEVGSIVKLNVNGAATEFLVVHQGLPSDIYDASCNGTWLLMKDCYESRAWHSSNVNDYENSDIHAYLNSSFLGLLDSNIQEAVKQVKIPYRAGSGVKKTVTSGAGGLPAKIFLLSANEAALVYNTLPTNEGATLSYFTGCDASAADEKRVAYLNGTATEWWLRTPNCYANNGATRAVTMNAKGRGNVANCSNANGIRPAFVLPDTLLVSEDGTVTTNTPPVITSESGESGVDLGTKNAAFSFGYMVSDEDGDALTVTEKLDGVVKKTRTNVTSGTQLTFECASTAAEFQKILNGTHTITIEASDGKDTTVFTASFTKAVYSASITLKEPLAVDGDITAAIMSVLGEIPAGATYKVEVTNNAKDSSPVWQDVTSEVQNGSNIVFENNVAANGAAFNFRVTAARGTSAGGYISGVSGAFQ